MKRDNGEETVRIPIRVLSNGTVAMESGARLPKILSGALGDLVLPAASLENPDVVAALNESSSTPLLAQGEVVWVRLHPSQAPAEKLESFEHEPLHPEMVGHVFAPITLDEALNLVTRGTKRGQLERATCSVPTGAGGKPTPATSLNHAYRLLSERFESHRVSFGGNVFESAFVKRAGTWHRLETLRRAAESVARRVVDRAIGDIEAGRQRQLFLDSDS
jgi:hypothetical protein